MRKTFLLSVIGMLLFSACQKYKDEKPVEKPIEDQQPDDRLGCITGKITIFNTGGTTDAYVQLLASKNGGAIYSKRLGTNGDYTIDNVSEGVYYFKVYKKNFVDTLFHETIRILPKAQNGGDCRSMDWAISKLPPHLYVVGVNTENVIHVLDFGESDERCYFQLYNNSETTYSWSTDFDEVRQTKRWLGSMNKVTGSLKPNETESISITIDRSGLEIGENTAKFLIDSDKGGGWELTISATCLRDHWGW